MTRQESIKARLKQFSFVVEDKKGTLKGYKLYDGLINQILNYLHDNDVVIKVERKEPFNCGHAQMAAARYSRDVTCPLIEAGCGFFEPLIKEA